jgi:hypothetical protein
MRMPLAISKMLFVLGAVLLCATTAAAPADCPTISITCPSYEGPIEFTANVSPENPDLKLTFQWIVSRGEIKSGQGTSKITVDAERNGKSFGASVEVKGLPANCSKTASCWISHF